MRKVLFVLLLLCLVVFISCKLNPALEKAEKHTVTFYNGSDIYSTISVEEGKSMNSFFPVDPNKTDYSFRGWNTASNGSGEYYTANTPINGDVHLYAVWEYKGYTITFNISGAIGNTVISSHSFIISNPYQTMDNSVDSIHVFDDVNGYLREYYIASCTADGATVSSSGPLSLSNFKKKNIIVNIVLGRLL